MIYLDNAATSWPKAEGVAEAVAEAMSRAGNPGRSGHAMSLYATRKVEETRRRAAMVFGAARAEQVVFALNGTDALNMAIHGILRPGDHVITSAMEHNSVMRPLASLAALDVHCTVVPTDPVCGADPAGVRAAVRRNTKLMIFCHVSNVCGTVNPIREIGTLCREAGIPLLVDAAQSAGTRPINVEGDRIDLLAFPGHKGLLGPQGTGGLYIRPGLEFPPPRQGGTGSRSDSMAQPDEMPDKFESGTQNTHGLAGLEAGIRFVDGIGADRICAHEAALAGELLAGLHTIKGVSVLGPPAGAGRSGVVALTINGVDPAEAGLILDESFGICVRAGFHCAPMAHKTLGTAEKGGALRISLGWFNTKRDVESVLNGLAEIAAETA